MQICSQKKIMNYLIIILSKIIKIIIFCIECNYFIQCTQIVLIGKIIFKKYFIKILFKKIIIYILIYCVNQTKFDHFQIKLKFNNYDILYRI